MPKRRNKNKEPKQRQIESDDDLSASGPEVSDEESEEEELHETEVMRVQGRSDSEDDDIDDEYEATGSEVFRIFEAYCFLKKLEWNIKLKVEVSAINAHPRFKLSVNMRRRQKTHLARTNSSAPI